MLEKRYILFTSANEWVNIPINSIRYFETYKRLVTVYYGNQSFEFFSYSFESIVKQLAGVDFIRTHRSYLVALKEIDSISFHELTTRNGIRLPVGRTYYSEVKAALKNFEHIHTAF